MTAFFSRIMVSIVVAVFILFVALQINHVVLYSYNHEEKEGADKQLELVAGALSQSMNLRLNLTKSLEAFVAINRNFSSQEFDRFSSFLQKDMRSVRSLQLAPDGVISYVSNIENNQSILGRNLLKKDNLPRFSQGQAQEGVYSIQGPYELEQGGIGVVARRSLYFVDTGQTEKSFWGFATVIIDTEPLFKDTGFFTLEDSYDLAVRSKNGMGSKNTVFYGDASVFDNALSVAEIKFPNTSWQLAIKKKLNSTPTGFLLSKEYWLVSTVIAVLLAMLTYLLINQPRLLRRQVFNATESLRTTLLSIGDAVIATDIDGRVTQMNFFAESLTGWSFDDAKGKHLNEVFNIIHAESKKASVSPVVRILESGKAVGLSNGSLLIAKNGAQYHIADSGAPIRDRHDEVTGLVLVFRDVTEEYAVRMSLQESESRFRNLFETSEVSIWNEDLSELYEALEKIREEGVSDLRDYLNKNTEAAWKLVDSVKVIQVNQATLNLFGAAAENELIPKINETFGPQAIDVFIEELCAIWNRERVFRAEAILLRLDGKEINAIISFSIPPTKEGYKSVPVSILDLTKLKRIEEALRESEEKYRGLYENAPFSYQSLNESGHLRDVNPAWLNTLGYERDEVIGQWFGDFLHPDYKAYFEKKFPEFKRSGCVHDVQFKIRHKQGHYIDVSFEGCIGHTANGEFKQTYCVFMDISARIQAEKEKNRLQRELEQAHKMEALGQLTGGIAHDFNNILGVIMGYTSMALDRYASEVPDKLVNYLTTSMKASERARDLVAQMMVFSRQGDSTDNSQPSQLAPMVQETIKMLHSILPSSIKVEVKCDDNMPNVLINQAKLQQMLMNLCVNARDAMKGVGELSIALGWARNVHSECMACHRHIEGDWIELSVSDTGSGMSADVLEHVFDPFFTTKKVGEGTGMGLSVLHGILTEHDGHVLIQSVLGKGTSFYLFLPPAKETLLQTAEKASIVNVEKDNSLQGDLPQGAGQHILVVDDEEALVEYTGSLLTSFGYEVTVMVDSLKALEVFENNPDKFSLLVTDQTMPALTGVELVAKIRGIRGGFPAIICSGYSRRLNTVNVESMAIGYLKKPFDAKQLIQLVGEHLGIV